MTKLMQWIALLVPVLTLWIAGTKSILKEDVPIMNQTLSKQFTLAFPIIFLAIFGMYAVAALLWRVYNFNDCPEAAQELQKEIQEAKADLATKGLKFE